MKLLRHTLFNLAGLGLPLVVGLAAIPELLHRLGAPKFGLLTLIWAVVSYFSLFDLGLGRALTYRLTRKLACEPAGDVAPTVGTAMMMMSAVGVTAAVIMASLASAGVDSIRGVPDRDEAVRSLLAMSLAVPAVVVTTGLRGILEARQAFGWVNLIRMPLGLYTFLAPLAVATWIGPRLDLIAASLLVGRVLALAAHYAAARHVLPSKRISLNWQRSEVRPLLTTGGWLTVGNLAGPLLGYSDRFIIAAAASAAAVAYYTTPNELVTKLWVIPGALTSVLFPALSAAAGRAEGEAQRIANHGMAWLFVTLLPLTLGLAMFSFEILAFWIGHAFASESSMVLRLMALGIMINCMAHVPLTLLQGTGHSREPAILQWLQLPPYLALLWWATTTFGVNGAAAVWTVRMAFDTAAMFFISERFNASHTLRKAATRSTKVVAAIGLAAFAAAFLALSLEVRLVIWIAAGIAVAMVLQPWRAGVKAANASNFT